MSRKKYRGLTAAIRFGMNSGQLQGELTEDAVRNILTDERYADLPEGTITKSLAYMAKNCEVQKVHGKYFSKEVKTVSEPVSSAPQASMSKPQIKSSDVCVIGKLVGTSMNNGRMIANVEVTTLDYK